MGFNVHGKIKYRNNEDQELRELKSRIKYLENVKRNRKSYAVRVGENLLGKVSSPYWEW